MGWKLKKINTHLKENEEQDITLVLQHEKRAAIHGVVRLPDGSPAVNALVKLFKKTENKHMKFIPVTFMYTDESGEFMFGVDSCVKYMIKVAYYVPEKCYEINKNEADSNGHFDDYDLNADDET